MRIALMCLFAILALGLFLPSTPLKGRLPGFWADNVPKIVLGLDLQGGMQLVLNVDKAKAVENHVHMLSTAVEDALKKKNIPFRAVERRGLSVLVGYPDESTANAIKKLMGDEFPLLSPSDAPEQRLEFRLDAKETDRIKDWAHTQALETIRNRIDKFGVSEPVIQRQGESEIVIQLPGMRDPKRAIELIGRTAVLEFRLVDESMDPSKALSTMLPFKTEILYQQPRQKIKGRPAGAPEGEKIPYLVGREVLLTGDALSDARVAFDTQYNEPYVSLTFDPNGARVFEKITRENVGKRLAIVLDGVVHSAPQIKEAIGGGRAQISGAFTYEEAGDLAIVLRAGALPAPVNIIQNVTVGPTLGADSVRTGIRAAVIGGILVLLFMLVYYKFSGLVADFAMFLNIVMLLGAMASLSSTLTLPGIAGIILTIGMGVDSNVLIFERIKEELKAGRTPRSAVNAGYDRALWTVIDSHVTTLITAAVLFQFGSGPIKGFAVSLSLGIIINLFTALVGTKIVFDIQNEKMRVKSISI